MAALFVLHTAPGMVHEEALAVATTQAVPYTRVPHWVVLWSSPGGGHYNLPGIDFCQDCPLEGYEGVPKLPQFDHPMMKQILQACANPWQVRPMLTMGQNDY